MGVVTLVLFVAAHVAATPAACQEHGPSTPVSSALRFFDAFASADVQSAFHLLRPLPVSTQERSVVRTLLPPTGAVTPTAAEFKKLEAIQPVLIYHERVDVFDIKVIDLPQAFIGLYGRAILLISRPALKVLTALDLQAVAAHELAHDFLWSEFELRRSGPARQELELECDGIAALTLVALALDPTRVLEAARKMERFNEQFGTSSSSADYPTLQDRQCFLHALLSHRR